MDVTTWTLGLEDPDAVVPPARPAPAGWTVERRHDPALNADLYRRVGAGYEWTDRLTWTPARWTAWAARVQTWVGVLDGEVTGFFELDVAPAAREAEIAIFGLLPEATGRGLGGHLLTAALRRGFALAPRVWVHTCSLDGPHALANYRARGLRVERVHTAPALPAPPSRPGSSGARPGPP